MLTGFGRNRYDGASAVAIQRDGKVVTAGSTTAAAGSFGAFALARYTQDGRLDSG